MTALHIAVLGHIRHPVARPFMGGMEAHCWHLVQALCDRGHEVTLFAAGDSDAPGNLHPVIPRHYDADLPWHDWHGSDRLNDLLDSAYGGILGTLASGAFDLVHNNSLHRFPPRLARRERLPTLTSLHVPPFGPLRRAVHASAAPWSHFTVCSAEQRKQWWPDGAPDEAHLVPNGIDLNVWPYQPQGNGSAVWAGRITPTKGAEVAVQAARMADIPLTLFGAIEHRDYFEERIRPHLGGDIRYGGHLSQTELAREIGAASVFLFTPLWDEPFGLVAAEAMACGTPVAALPMGAVAEVLGEDGGVLARDCAVEALVDAMYRALALPRKAVHDRAAARYGIERMVSHYEALYLRALDGAADRTVGPVEFEPVELPSLSTDKRLEAAE
ncbi:MAG: glycosyltransferase family 4 protein [Sulfitobacter sp.]|nr:glycosyltransferase family 4 protein [Sulfitobacter sp.]